MRQIRRNTFETNSSSSHSFVIMKDEAIKDNEENYNTPVYYTAEEICEDEHYASNYMSWEFGRWPFKVLDNFWGKFAYAYANQYSKEELLCILKEAAPDCKEPIFSEDAYVDDLNLKYWLEEHKVSLKEFLTSRKYIVICDGDEYNIWTRMINSGLIDTSTIENYKD